MKKYVKSDSGDFSNIQWKSQPCTIHGLNQPSMYYTKDLGDGYYATVRPEYRKKIDVVVWVALIYKVNELQYFESFETSYDAKDWVDYESYDMCIKSVTASTKPVCASSDDKWTVSDWLGWFDFGYEWSDEPNSEGETGWAFVDYQNVYLGDIADERYDDPRDMIGRIADGSSYWIDYIDQDLEDEYGYSGDNSLEDEYEFAKSNPEIHESITQLIYYALHPEELIVDQKK